ncbi:hypothetical protein R6Q57_023786 [Mikania cordata]
MVAPSTNLHFVMFPAMAQGHMVPMVDTARILAQRGATVTIITTPLIANRVRSVISRASMTTKLKIQLLELQLPLTEVGLPEGCESFDMLESFESSAKLFNAIELIEQHAEDLLRELYPPPDCIIADFFFPRATDVARRLNIPRLVFHGTGCFWLVCVQVDFTSNMFETIDSDSDSFLLPGLPHRVEVTKLQFLSSSNSSIADQNEFWFRAIKAEEAAYGIIIHTFKELEPEYVK